MRNEALAKKEKPRYNGHYRELQAPYRDDPTASSASRTRSKGSVVFEDVIKGRIEWSNTELDDLVIWPLDGYPTYNFASWSTTSTCRSAT
jgi:glutamyl-tRNA synthetase